MKTTDFPLRRADTGKSFCMEVIDVKLLPAFAISGRGIEHAKGAVAISNGSYHVSATSVFNVL